MQHQLHMVTKFNEHNLCIWAHIVPYTDIFPILNTLHKDAYFATRFQVLYRCTRRQLFTVARIRELAHIATCEVYITLWTVVV